MRRAAGEISGIEVIAAGPECIRWRSLGFSPGAKPRNSTAQRRNTGCRATARANRPNAGLMRLLIALEPLPSLIATAARRVDEAKFIGDRRPIQRRCRDAKSSLGKSEGEKVSSAIL
jgi:hypothetical protein